jgi:hypothetical protein
MIAPEAFELARLEQEAAALRQTLGGCSVAESETPIQGLSVVQDKNDKRAMVLANTVASDLAELAQVCQRSDAATRLLSIQQHSGQFARRLGITGDLPSHVMDAFQVAEDEKRLEAISEATVRGMDRAECDMSELPSDLLSWHAFFLQNGYVCTVKTYKTMAQELNVQTGRENAQAGFDSLASQDLKDLKKLFKETFATELKDKRMKIAFIPQLSYENGMLTGLFPYSLFMDQTEKTSYVFLKRELSRLGVDVEIIYRNSLASLDAQVKETEEQLAKLNGPHLVISRSMGSRVMNEIKKRSELGIGIPLDNVASWFNIGGTPNGSVIAEYKTRPDTFYRGVFPQVAGTLKLPVGLIAKDPRVVDHLPDTIYSALDRSNLKTMAHHEELNALGDPSSALKIYNLVFLAPGYERATSGVDPVYTHMLSYGPTEGSAPLVGAAVHSTQSARVFYDLDHLAYWKLTPNEGLALYLRAMIAAHHEKLTF